MLAPTEFFFLCRKAGAGDFNGCDIAVDFAQFVCGEDNRGGGNILLHMRDLGRNWDRSDPWLLCQQPCKRDLRGSDLFSLRTFANDCVKRGTRYDLSSPIKSRDYDDP